MTLMRRQLFGSERYPFIIWLVCHIDLHAVFSGSGSGEFINTMLENDMMPPPSFHLYPLGLDGSSVIYTDEVDTLPAILQLNYDISILAARLGQLGRELRKEAVSQSFPNESVQKRIDTKMRQRRIFELQEAFRQLWQAPTIILIEQSANSLPARSLEIYQQVSLSDHCAATSYLLYRYRSNYSIRLILVGFVTLSRLYNLFPHEHVARSTHGHRPRIRR
jgi:hypothetical protein